jgi:hypothetical protein
MRKENTYILRIWSDSAREDTWRASLENLKTKEQQVFPNLDALLEFLKEHPELISAITTQH